MRTRSAQQSLCQPFSRCASGPNCRQTDAARYSAPPDSEFVASHCVFWFVIAWYSSEGAKQSDLTDRIVRRGVRTRRCSLANLIGLGGGRR
jgi:hypothetical protein